MPTDPVAAAPHTHRTSLPTTLRAGLGVGAALALALCFVRRLDSGLASIGQGTAVTATYAFLAGVLLSCAAGALAARRRTRGGAGQPGQAACSAPASEALAGRHGTRRSRPGQPGTGGAPESAASSGHGAAASLRTGQPEGPGASDGGPAALSGGRDGLRTGRAVQGGPAAAAPSGRGAAGLRPGQALLLGLGCLAGASLAFSSSLGATLPAALVAAGGLVCGACLACVAMGLFEATARMGVAQLTASCAVAVGVAGVAQALFKVASLGPATWALAALLCVAAPACLAGLRGTPQPQGADGSLDVLDVLGTGAFRHLPPEKARGTRGVLTLTWVAFASLLFCAFIAGLTWDPVLSDETGWRDALPEVVGVLAGAVLTCGVLVLMDRAADDERQLRLLSGAALPVSIALVLIVPVVKLMVQGEGVALISTALSTMSFSLIGAVCYVELAVASQALGARAEGCARAALASCAACAAAGMALIEVVGTGGRVLCFLLEAAFFTAVAVSYALMSHGSRPASEAGGADAASDADRAGTRDGDGFVARCSALAQQGGLSPRERDVLLHLGRGYGSTHIAKELGISENTVRTHVRHIYEKLGVSGREELFALIDRR